MLPNKTQPQFWTHDLTAWKFLYKKSFDLLFYFCNKTCRFVPFPFFNHSSRFINPNSKTCIAWSKIRFAIFNGSKNVCCRVHFNLCQKVKWSVIWHAYEYIRFLIPFRKNFHLLANRRCKSTVKTNVYCCIQRIREFLIKSVVFGKQRKCRQLMTSIKKKVFLKFFRC